MAKATAIKYCPNRLYQVPVYGWQITLKGAWSAPSAY